jgi:hypothetical protein
MAYSDRIEHKLEIIPPYSVIQCRETAIVEKDGIEIARNHNRYIRNPGDDVSGDCAELQSVANALWTDEVIASFKDFITQQNNSQ